MYSLYIYIFIVEEKKGEKKDLQTVFTQQHQRQEIKLKNKKKSHSRLLWSYVSPAPVSEAWFWGKTVLTWTPSLCPVSVKTLHCMHSNGPRALCWGSWVCSWKTKKVCTCFVTAATAVQKLLAALRYLWGLRSAMAESSRGKLVLFLFFFFFFEKLHQRHEDAHTHTCPAAPPESVQVRVRASASQRFACFVFMYTYTVYIYRYLCICEHVCCLWCVGIWGKRRVNVSDRRLQTSRQQEKDSRSSRTVSEVGRRGERGQVRYAEEEVEESWLSRGMEGKTQTKRLHFRITILYRLASTSCSLFSSLARF